MNLWTLNQKTEGYLTLTDKDLYHKNKEITDQIEIKIKFSDYCFNKKCRETSSCEECQTVIKRLNNRYNEVQGDL